jgi:hypothetical protein
MDAVAGTLEEIVPGGGEIRLRPRGRGRFSSAVFLILWLCFWAAGEAFALWILVSGAISLITGRPPEPGRDPLELGPAVAVGAFLVLWLAVWTFGGVMAIHELLRLVWSEDRITATPGGILVVHGLGPFRRTRGLTRDVLRRIYVSPGDGRLRAETVSETVELSSLGSVEERERVAALLRSELALSEELDTSTPEAVPSGWQEIVDPEGRVALVRDLRARRLQTRLAAVAAMVAAAIALVLVLETFRDPGLAVLATMACALAAGLGWMALRLGRSRLEWTWGDGRLTLRRRFGSRGRELFAGAALELTVTHDSDGDDWYELSAVQRHTASPSGVDGDTVPRRRITHSIYDPTEPRRLGLWLSRRAGVPFEDLTTDERRAAERARLLDELSKSGAPGRLAARLLRRSDRR